VPKSLTGFRAVDKAITRLFVSVRTTDAERPVLSAVPGAHNPSMFGSLRWTGNVRAELIKQGYTATQIEAAIGAATAQLSRYGGKLDTSELTSGPAGSLRTADPRARPEKVFGEPTSAEAMQKANEEFWQRKEDEKSESDWAEHRTGDASTRATPADINAVNGKFWANRLGRPRELTLSAPTARTGDGGYSQNSMAALISSMNDANARFWDNQRAAHPQPFSKPYGKG